MKTKKISAICLITAISIFFFSCEKEDETTLEEMTLAGNYRKDHDVEYYVGDFNEIGEPHGKGTFYWSNGNKYEGDWLNGGPHGKGTYYWSNGDRYEGDWLNNKRTGKGTIYWSNGDTYEGDWLNNERTGKGTYIYKDGTTFTCTWANGMPTDEKCYLLRNMKAWYFWNREIGKVDVNQYADAKSLLNALKKTEDIRSNISVAGENSLFLEAGKELGYGMGVRWNSTGDLRVAWVHGGSPAQARGVKRGWQVLSIDGEDVNSMAEINITPQQKGVQKVFAFKDENGATQNLSLASNEYHIQSVLYSNSYPRDGKKVGYIVLKSFVSQNRDEILQGIHSLSSEGIRELVLDLRYCVGGNYILLNQFADYVFPGSADGKTFMNRVYNEDRRDSDTSYVINKTGSISLSRVFVLTTASTANLGEYLLLNLKPYVSVIQIGAKTNGYDAYGISYWNFNSTVQHNLITTIFQNAEGNSCVGGIMPDYRISDGLDRDWGDPDEALLGAALSYIETGQIPQKSLLKAFPNSSGLPEIIEPKHDSY